MFRTIVFSGLFLVYSSLNSQSKGPLQLFVADQTLYEGNTYSFPVYSSNFTDIVGFQFTLNLPTEFVDSASLYLANLVTTNSFFYWKKEWNQLGLSWVSPDAMGFSIPKDSALFSFYLKMKKTVSVKDLILIPSKGYVSSECLYLPSNTKDITEIGINLNYDPGVTALVLSANDLTGTNNEIKIYPNPCKAGSTLELKTDENINSFEWFNMEGKSISTKQTLNHNQFSIPSHFSNGSYFIHFNTTNKKLVKARIEVVD